MKKVLLVFYALLCVVSCCACGNNVSNGNRVTGTYLETSEDDPNTLKTKYCDIVLPDDYVGTVKYIVVSEDPYVIAFVAIADNTELYRLIFDRDMGSALGTFLLQDKNVVVSISSAKIDATNPNFETYCNYQGEINSILQEWVRSDYFVADEIVAPEDSSVFDIKTDVVTLKYPTKWKDKVEIDISPESVKFSSDGMPIFDLYFEKCDGFLLGTYNGTPIYVVDYLIQENKCGDYEYRDLCAMQENINVIIHYLMEDSCFVISQ